LTVIQARANSTRFPGKVLKPIGDKTVIELVAQRLSRSKLSDHIVVAIPDSSKEDELSLHLQACKVDQFRGSEKDVQSRFIECGLNFNTKWIVRITGDCPLIDAEIVDSVIELALKDDVDYASNVNPPSMPDGLDVEVFKLSSLIACRNQFDSSSDREHVTVNLRESGNFRTANLSYDEDLSIERWTIDYPDDLQIIMESLPKGFEGMGWMELRRLGFRGVTGSTSVRNEGMKMNEGQKLWARAKRVIPGGSMLLSKRPEMFLPDQWPTYYSRAKGILVEDLDGNVYKDFSTMSVGACSLGYGNKYIDDAVIAGVQDGVMSTLNSPGEVYLAEKLVELHPWADMARFARSGGEANAIAVRIARAHTKRDKVAICGYHGWHDWYLAANLNSDTQLDGHLLPGLEPSGVPRALIGTTTSFQYNDYGSLEALISKGEYAAVQMEVSRNFGPDKGFLERIRELCTATGTVLIFDECTSGFRETYGGLHLKFGVNPDMAMFGKALGNGYAITGVIGISDVMQSAQSSFISSTFWTERLGPLAALATLSEMRRLQSWNLLPETGRKIKEFWRNELTNLGLPYSVFGLDAIPSFKIEAPHWQILKTLFTQDMLRKGYLASASVYVSTEHSDLELEGYFQAFRESMKYVEHNFDENSALKKLDGEVSHSGFTRLN
jgi:glutamate-1-semialdehyde 2,1-aminomutase